jgi:O-antigen biosynthesis protein
MDKSRLKVKHYWFLAKRIGISILEFLHIKNFIRKTIDIAPPVFKESLDVDKMRKTVIVLPNMPWGFRKQRPQQIFSRLAEKNFNIFYVSPVTSGKEYISVIEKNVYEVHCKAKTSGDILRFFHLSGEEESEFVNSLKRLLSEYIKKDSLLFVLHPVWGNVAFKIDGVKRIYDLMDLYSGFDNAKKELIESEEGLIINSDMVITTAQNLFEHAKKLNKNTHLIRNGCDYEMFNKIEKNGILDCLQDSPIIGYYGALSGWLDVEMLDEVIKKNRDKYFVFIGAINTPKVIRLYKYSNVYFLGEVKNSELPGYLAYFDVCTIPFVLSDLIKSTNPVKFYEYISSGKPVVSVKLPELEQYSDICYLYDNAEEFSKYIFEALHDDTEELKKKRMEVASENSWDSRVKEIIKIIK